jgi:hypothetical protein
MTGMPRACPGNSELSFAAIQAAEHGGRKTVVEAVSDLAEEAMIIIEESKKDDKEDKNKDGVKDVDQITKKEYMTRKTKLVLKKMNPEKVDKAIAAMYRVWLAVIAVLTIQFARTISLALTISDFLRMPVDRFIAPTINIVMPADYKKWVPIVLGWYVGACFLSLVTGWGLQCRDCLHIALLSPFLHGSFIIHRITKSIAISIAWYLQTIISAFSSALAGGLMMARALFDFGIERGWFSGSHEDTPVDEFASYLFAALGFYFQYSIRFDVPFPFNLLLWPLGKYLFCRLDCLVGCDLFVGLI